MLRGLNSADNEYFKADVTSRIVWNFQNKKQAQPSTLGVPEPSAEFLCVNKGEEEEE